MVCIGVFVYTRNYFLEFQRYNSGMVLFVGFLSIFATLLGGTFALKFRDKLHLIMGFSAGAVIGAAFFDMLPESIELGSAAYGISTVTSCIAFGFLLFMILSRMFLLHPHSEEDEHTHHTQLGYLGAGSLAIHSFLDGMSIGLAFQVSTSVGIVIATAVLAHNFSDGINTVSLILHHIGDTKRAFRWLMVNAIAPFLGIFVTQFISLPESQLGLLLALFCGFYLYIAASDLLPESHHKHPKLITSIMTLLGALTIYMVIRFATF